ncbi:alpha-(1,3)-fucosyltransferase C-like isoform X2 [Argopecten irradians]|uniref:alpha-(1,3)-fucosyltransferase C-like isoform X2 n=1 Tax=Argopecten irradians TaxID=31199 RepID=UPI00371686B5
MHIHVQNRQYVFYYGLSLLFLMTFVCFLYYDVQERAWTSTTIWVPNMAPHSNVTNTSDHKDGRHWIKREKQIVKRVLFWNFPSWHKRNIFDGCEYKCLITTDKSKIDDQDGVIFHSPSFRPPKKPRNQVWIFYEVEPPTISPNNHFWRRVINWTINYRRDADVISRYGSFDSKHLHSINRNASHIAELSTQKNASAAWFVGHCNTHGKRESFVRLLQRHMDVSIYGRCGNRVCVETDAAKTWSKNCLKRVEHNTRYYLSFENSLCRDYMTEKAYKVFKSYSLVPVVRGGLNYSIYLPPDTFIDSSRYNDATSLSKYLVDIKTNKTVFTRLFENRNLFKTNFNDNWGQKPFCEACRRLHYPEKFRRLYEDVSTWVRGQGETATCKTPTDLT